MFLIPRINWAALPKAAQFDCILSQLYGNISTLTFNFNSRRWHRHGPYAVRAEAV